MYKLSQNNQAWSYLKIKVLVTKECWTKRKDYRTQSDTSDKFIRMWNSVGVITMRGVLKNFKLLVSVRFYKIL